MKSIVVSSQFQSTEQCSTPKDNVSATNIKLVIILTAVDWTLALVIVDNV